MCSQNRKTLAASDMSVSYETDLKAGSLNWTIGAGATLFFFPSEHLWTRHLLIYLFIFIPFFNFILTLTLI